MRNRTLTALLLIGAALLLVACGPIHLPPFPPGPVCDPNVKGCDCYFFYLDGGWKYQACPTPHPSPTPSPCNCAPDPVCPPGQKLQTDGHTAFPCNCPIRSCYTPVPEPTPTPAPTPRPTPTPCVEHTETRPFTACPAGSPNGCWKCNERIAWEVERGNWTPVPGRPGLYYNDPGNDPRHREYLNAKCQSVTLDGRVLRGTESFGEPCVDGQGICPETETVITTCPSPSPSEDPCAEHPGEPCPLPSPVPSTPPPSPSPSTPSCPACPDITAIGTKVQLFQFNHQVVTGHQEGDTWVANGPADKLSLDATVLYGCGGPRCDSEHNACLVKCEDLRGPRYRILSGPARNCQPGNPGDDGRGFSLNCDVAHPSTGSWEVCTVSPWVSSETGLRVGGQACKVSHWRIP